MIKVQCPCGVILQLAPEWRGRKGKCPQCGSVLMIPAEEESSTTQPPVNEIADSPRPAPSAAPSTATSSPEAASLDEPLVVVTRKGRRLIGSVEEAPSVGTPPSAPANPAAEWPPNAPQESAPEPYAVSLPQPPAESKSLFERKTRSPTNSAGAPIPTQPPLSDSPSAPEPSAAWNWGIASVLIMVGAATLLFLGFYLGRNGDTDVPPGSANAVATGRPRLATAPQQPMTPAPSTKASQPAGEENPPEATHPADVAPTSNAVRLDDLPQTSVANSGSVNSAESAPPRSLNESATTQSTSTTAPRTSPSQSPPSTGQGTPISSAASTLQPPSVPSTATTAGASGSAATGSSPPRRAPGLQGLSREYDDLHCRQIQARHGIRIPIGATLIEVDGQRLSITNADALPNSASPFVLLPKGRHAVRFAPGTHATMVDVTDHLSDTYQQMIDFFHINGTIRRDELLGRGARTMDVHGAPFLLNFMGAAYAADQKLAAAERKFRRALQVNPTFSPAHLNLAYCLWRRGVQDEAREEFLLANEFNIGNVYGMAAALSEFRRQIGVSPMASEEVALRPERYESAESMSAEDVRLVALLETMSKYAIRYADRAKILNNIGAHFAESRRTELALRHYRNALSLARFADPEERFPLVREVLGHCSAACRQNSFDEADEYERMQSLVSP